MFSHSFHRLLQDQDKDMKQDLDQDKDQNQVLDKDLDQIPDQDLDQDLDLGTAVFRFRFIHVSKTYTKTYT
jgi:hypothetical protein